MKPIHPFEPVRTEKFPVGDNWIAQVKWDGVRILTYWDGNSVRLFNRKKNERTVQYPELTEINTYCHAASLILDGEVIALEKGKPSFHKVMKRDGLRSMENLNWARRNVEINYIVFDVLFYNGEWIISRTLEQRQHLLQKILRPAEGIYSADNFSNSASLFQAIQEQEMEGVVCKNLQSAYVLGGKDARWKKIKNYRDLQAVIGGVTLRENQVNALLLGAYDPEGRLWYIGHAGSGKFTRAEWNELTRQLLNLKQKNSPFINQPSRLQDAFWLEPQFTVKVKFMEWTEGGTLRQPSIQALIRVSPHECLLE
ncbi:RNA ligase family protein [Desulfitobacterium metallireducens]|uniref:DNA ligase (ATP) n=1 Tax=Desulfitobacterium metallireducens DSM 15288 TaxID=871968 RepID=W0E9V2_9FIRM|nr:RNA ligase family protein [Desulfitobacterium metallireducens]AHF07542.1 DNA ligase [Desulfitobacterium metallireducens DSM 15288]